MTEELNIETEESAVASEMEALQAELILARAEIENFHAEAAARVEEERLALVASATELGLKGHEDLSSETLTSLIASWEAARPVETPVEMKPVEASEAPAPEASPAPSSESVVANHLNGIMVETPQTLYAKAFNAWASAWNSTLAGSEIRDARIRAPTYEELNN